MRTGRRRPGLTRWTLILAILFSVGTLPPLWAQEVSSGAELAADPLATTEEILSQRQDVEPRSRLRLDLHQDWQELRTTARFMVVRPWHDVQRRPFLTLGVVSSLAALSNRKQGIRHELLEHQALGDEDGILSTSKVLGNWHYPVLATGALYLGGLLSGTEGARETGLVLGESLFFTGVLTTLGQSVLAEERPERGGQLRFFAPGGHGVSGHAATSVALTLPLVRRYLRIEPEDRRWARVLKRSGQVAGLSLPFLTGLSRIRDDEHFLWNVVAGWGIGYYVSDTVWKAHTGEVPPRSFRLVPAVSPTFSAEGSPGVVLTWRF